MHTATVSMQTRAPTHAHTRTHTLTHTFTYSHLRKHKVMCLVCTCVHTFAQSVYVRVCVRVCVCVCVCAACVYVCVCACVRATVPCTVYEGTNQSYTFLDVTSAQSRVHVCVYTNTINLRCVVRCIYICGCRIRIEPRACKCVRNKNQSQCWVIINHVHS